MSSAISSNWPAAGQIGRLQGDGTSITLFKSVGAALEDLAAAELAVGG